MSVDAALEQLKKAKQELREEFEMMKIHLKDLEEKTNHDYQAAIDSIEKTLLNDA